MSVKQRMAETIAELPESTTVEEAFSRLYQVFKQVRASGSEPARNWEAQFDRWLESHRQWPVLPEDACKRSSFYDERPY